MPPTVPRILADPTRLTQAIVNVIASVARFTREGATIMVRVSLVVGAQTVQVDVVSPGGGMADAELEKVFVAFRFPEQARKFGSLGLGLYIARTVMEIHGGAIHVMSGRSAARADGAPSPSTPALDAVAAAKDGIVFRLTIGAREQAESIHVRSMRVLPAS
jgi:signal transduction histidine kinase